MRSSDRPTRTKKKRVTGKQEITAGGKGAPVLWENLTWQEIGALAASGCELALLPVGATEQHGPHLGVGMDTLNATQLAHAVSTRTGAPVLPPLAYGCSLGHSRRWPGT